MAVPGFVTVTFHVVGPGPAETSWSPPFPTKVLFDAVRELDFSTGNFYMPTRLMGNEMFCQVIDGPLPLIAGYTRDTWSDRHSERKGEVRLHELEDDAAWVDPTYASFFPNDIVGIVRPTLNSPGSATMAHWLSQHGPHPFYLQGLQKADVFADLNRPADEMYGLHLRIHRALISLIRRARTDVATAFEHAARIGGGSATLSLGMQAGSRKERAAWWPPIRAVIKDLADNNLLVDFESAKVKVTGGLAVNLKDAYLTSRVPISRYDKKKFGPAQAADALGTAYHVSEPAILAAVEAWRGRNYTDGRGSESDKPESGQSMDQQPGN